MRHFFYFKFTKFLLYSSIFFLFIGFCEPKCIISLSVDEGGIWTTGHLFFLYARILSFFVAFFILLFFFRIDSFTILSILIMLCFFIGEPFGENNDLFKTIKYVSFSFSSILLIQYCSYKGKLNIIIKELCLILELLIVLNFVFLILFPNGLYHSFVYNLGNSGANGHFLGYKTFHIYYFIPYVFLKTLVVQKENSTVSYRLIFMLIVIFVSSILLNASLSTLLSFVFLVLNLFPKFFQYINSKVFIFSSLLFSFLLITSDYCDFITSPIANIFNKNSSISGRDFIWHQGISAWIDSPFTGTGLSNIPSNIPFLQYHNKYLDYLVVGGLCLCFLFIALLFLLSNKCDNSTSFERRAFLTALIGYSFLFIIESSREDILFWIISSVIYYHNINKKYLYKECKEANKET